MPPAWDEMAVVALVARPHGLRGEVILNPESDFPDERFQPGRVFYIQRAGIVEALTARAARFHRARPIVAFDGLESIERVEPLAGLELRVPVADLAPLPPGAFYQHDLVGCRVETTGGEAVGVVARVGGNAGSSHLVVLDGAQEVLIPLAADICRVIDVEARRVVIAPIDGLLELNVTRRSAGARRGRRT